jgi:FMN phosphatase YigB (HAD superfamily)
VTALSWIMARPGTFDLVSTDVFDTLLLRTLRSERSRRLRAETLFSAFLARQGIHVSARTLAQARGIAQSLAFRAIDTPGDESEVRLCDVIARQLRILGLSPDFVGRRIEIETEVELSSLRVNRQLVNALRTHRMAGSTIIAISDTTLSRDALTTLITRMCGASLISRIYASADLGLTKRAGGIFRRVLEIERIAPERALHIGDDKRADVDRPRAVGITACYLPRWGLLSAMRRADGALAAARIALSTSTQRPIGDPPQDAAAFGRDILGPVVTQFCLRMWLYASQAEATGPAAMLFCARGGVGIRQIFEGVLSAFSLPLAAHRETLLVSRLVAARLAFVRNRNHAMEEICREFQDRSCLELANALGGRRYDLAQEWTQPFDTERFLGLLCGASGVQILSDIDRQNRLFERHFNLVAGGAERILLCDTGLYGSTQKLLAAAMPEKKLESVLFARSNYKGLSQDHFRKTIGLMVERNGYSPFNSKTSVLRYWHLIERLFEPAIASVQTFCETADGGIAANCGPAGYGAIDATSGNELLAGVLEYVAHLPGRTHAVAFEEAETAWLKLKRAITSPSPHLGAMLGSGERSVDFGRAGSLNIAESTRGQSITRRLAMLKEQPWREGAIARDFPLLRHAALPLMGALHVLRGLRG